MWTYLLSSTPSFSGTANFVTGAFGMRLFCYPFFVLLIERFTIRSLGVCALFKIELAASVIIVNRKVSPWLDSVSFFEVNGQSYEYYAKSHAKKNAKVKRIVYLEQPNLFILVKQKETNDFHFIFSP